MKTSRIIPEGAFIFKEGLYIYEYETTVDTISFLSWDLYSADGYCFYDLQQPENYDEDGKLLPEENRVYARFMLMRKDEEYVRNNIISIPLKDEYEIV